MFQLESLKEFGDRLLAENHFDSKNIKKQLGHVVKRWMCFALWLAVHFRVQWICIALSISPVVRCPSVCPSVSWYCVKELNIIRLLSPFILNAAPRLVLLAMKLDHKSPLLHELHWVQFQSGSTSGSALMAPRRLILPTVCVKPLTSTVVAIYVLLFVIAPTNCSTLGDSTCRGKELVYHCCRIYGICQSQ